MSKTEKTELIFFFLVPFFFPPGNVQSSLVIKHVMEDFKIFKLDDHKYISCLILDSFSGP